MIGMSTAPTLKTLIKQLDKQHDPVTRNVIAEIEKLIAERDAYAFKYDQALQRIECLECQLAKQEHECPVYIREKAHGKFKETERKG